MVDAGGCKIVACGAVVLLLFRLASGAVDCAGRAEPRPRASGGAGMSRRDSRLAPLNCMACARLVKLQEKLSA